MRVFKNGTTIGFKQGMKFGNLKLRHQLTLMFFSVLSISLVALGIGSFVRMIDVIKENLIANSESMIQQIQQEYVVETEKYELMLAALVIDSHVNSFTENADPAEMLKDFNEFLALDKDLKSVYLATPSGKLLAQPHADLPADYNPTERPWYIEALKEDRLIWTDPYIDAATGEMSITVARPLYSTSGTFTGIIAMDLSMNTIADNVSKTKVGNTGYIFMVDSHGNMMVHPNKSVLGKPVPVPSLKDEIATKASSRITYTTDVNGKHEKRTAVFTTLEKTGWKIGASINEQDIKEDAIQLISIIVVIGILTMGIAFIAIMLFSKRISNRIQVVINAFEAIKSGDFTQSVSDQYNDEIGNLAKDFNTMRLSLTDLIYGLRKIALSLTDSAAYLATTSDETSAAAFEVAKTVEEIAIGAENQATDAEHGAQRAHALSDRFVILNQNTTEMLEGTRNVMCAQAEGNTKLVLLQDKTNENQAASEHVEQVIEKLSAQTESIHSILDSISNIAQQTNLLALNASIEAARAGEHGRGFAVVAEAIKKLADQSSRASDEVKVMLNGIKADSDETALSVNKMRGITREQAAAVQGVFQAFNKIESVTEEIQGKMGRMSNTIEILNQDKDVILEDISNIVSVSEETAASAEEVTASMQQQTYAVEEVAKSADALNTLAMTLEKHIKHFRVAE